MLTRIANRLRRDWKRLTKPKPYPQTVEISDHSPRPIKFRIHSDTERFRTVAYGGEREQLGVFFQHLKENDVVYDIGASIGLTVLLSAAWASKGQVIAFEPDKEILQRLDTNIKLNGFKNITVLPYAISHSNQMMRFYSAGADDVSPSLTGKNVKGLQLAYTDVEARTLDSLIETKEIPAPSVLKIDIEGAEYDALRGAEKLLMGEIATAPRLLFVELHPDFLVDYKVDVETIREFIQSAGYKRIWQVQRDAQIHEIYTRE